MIFGIGTDIIEVKRIAHSFERYGDRFARRILAEDEWQAFEESKTKARFLAKRFAAKEAFSKALGTGIRPPVTFQTISITHDVLGKPMLAFEHDLTEYMAAQHIKCHHLSISDERELAVAFVVLEF